MSLQGSLDTFALPDVLVLLASTKKSGELHVAGQPGGRSLGHQPDTEGRLWFDAGGLVGSDVGQAPSRPTRCSSCCAWPGHVLVPGRARRSGGGPRVEIDGRPRRGPGPAGRVARDRGGGAVARRLAPAGPEPPLRARVDARRAVAPGGGRRARVLGRRRHRPPRPGGASRLPGGEGAGRGLALMMHGRRRAQRWTEAADAAVPGARDEPATTRCPRRGRARSTTSRCMPVVRRPRTRTTRRRRGPRLTAEPSDALDGGRSTPRRARRPGRRRAAGRGMEPPAAGRAPAPEPADAGARRRRARRHGARLARPSSATCPTSTPWPACRPRRRRSTRGRGGAAVAARGRRRHRRGRRGRRRTAQPGPAAQVPVFGPQLTTRPHDSVPGARSTGLIAGRHVPMGGLPMSEDNQLGSLLIARGLLTPEQLDAALEEQERTHRSLGRILIDQGLVTEAGLVSTLASQLGLDYVDVADYAVDASAATLISDALARRYQALPIGWQDGPAGRGHGRPEQRVRRRRHPHHHRCRGAHGGRRRGRRSWPPSTSTTASTPTPRSITAQASSTFEAEDDLTSVREVTEDAPIVKLVNLLITQAIAGPGVGHPHRAGRARPAGPLPHRRRAPRGDAAAEEHPVGHHQPAQDHGRHQHRRAAHAPGRPHQRHDRRPRRRPAGRHPAHGLRREGRHADPRQVDRPAAPRRPRLPARPTGPASSRPTASPTGRSSSPVRPGRASRPRSTPP